jgi:hypothetical protein
MYKVPSNVHVGQQKSTSKEFLHGVILPEVSEKRLFSDKPGLAIQANASYILI